MSLLLFTINKITFQAVSIDGREWCRVKDVYKVLEYREKTAHIIRAHCSMENVAQKYQMRNVGVAGTTINSPSDSQKYDFYINEEGLYELLLSNLLKGPLRSTAIMSCFLISDRS